MSGLERVPALRPAHLLAGAVLLLAAALVVVALQLRGDDGAHERACAEWARLLEQRTAENRAGFGKELAEQFHREMVASGTIDLGDRVVHRPDGC